MALIQISELLKFTQMVHISLCFFGGFQKDPIGRGSVAAGVSLGFADGRRVEDVGLLRSQRLGRDRRAGYW